MEFGLFQQQSTSLMMTQKLQQAIHLLQLSALDLTTFINEEAIENPLLDVEERNLTEQMDMHSPIYMNSSYRRSEDEPSPIDYACTSRLSLSEYLLHQVQDLTLTTKVKEQLTYFIYSLRDDGYLSRPLHDLCDEFNISLKEGERTLEILQSLEPAGIGAKNLQECLLLQLQRLKKRYPLAEQIILLYMEDFAKRRWRYISDELGVTMKEIQAVFDFLQTLDPYPGSHFTKEPVQFIIPELRITVVEGELYVQFIDDLIPNVSLNNRYDQLSRNESDRKLQAYLQEQRKKVQWLIKSIEQRKQTILKVGETIAHYQKEFFLRRNGTLQPLTLKDVAREINMHESTVSRATTNKYVETPKGLIELKALFSVSLNKSTGKTVSSQLAQERLQAVIEKENKKSPLSDAAIANMLQEQFQLTISRRTVAKYRNELGIPSSMKRKRY